MIMKLVTGTTEEEFNEKLATAVNDLEKQGLTYVNSDFKVSDKSWSVLLVFADVMQEQRKLNSILSKSIASPSMLSSF